MDRDKLVSEDKVQLGPLVLETFRVLRAHLVGLIALGLVLLVPLELLGAALTRQNPDIPRSGAPVGADALTAVIELEPVLGDLLVFLIAVPVLAGTVALVVVAAQLGRELPIGDAWRVALRRLPALLGVTVALALGAAVVIAVAALIDLVVPEILPSGSISSVLGVVVLLAGFTALLPFAVAGYPAAAVEGGGAIDTVRSVVRSGRQSFVDLLGRGVALVALASVLGALVRFVLMLVIGLLGSGWAIQAIGEAVADLVFIPLFAGGATLAYLDLRGRRGEVDRDQLRRATEVGAGRTGAGEAQGTSTP